MGGGNDAILERFRGAFAQENSARIYFLFSSFGGACCCLVLINKDARKHMKVVHGSATYCTPAPEPTDINPPALPTARSRRSDFSNVYGISIRKKKQKKQAHVDVVRETISSLHPGKYYPEPERNPRIRPPDGVFFGHPSRSAHESPLFLHSSRLLFAFLPSVLFFFPPPIAHFPLQFKSRGQTFVLGRIFYSRHTKHDMPDRRTCRTLRHCVRTQRNPATAINASWAQSGSLAYFMCALLSHLLG